ncbi:hypothetical protein GCM10009530_12050 [Microbispora corallina]|uniref:Uncharacterized protein n=1 Tax=Microbispora corallina TaxID=83302 RepID=A0ABQ4FTF9_9ACTN|nr:hypothetical protein Mco01_10980 [Microbispora corallina]
MATAGTQNPISNQVSEIHRRSEDHHEKNPGLQAKTYWGTGDHPGTTRCARSATSRTSPNVVPGYLKGFELQKRLPHFLGVKLGSPRQARYAARARTVAGRERVAGMWRIDGRAGKGAFSCDRGGGFGGWLCT